MCSTLYHTIMIFKDPKEEGFGKHCRKMENAGGNQHFLFIHPVFYSIQRERSSFWERLMCCLEMLSIWSHPKFCHCLKGPKNVVY